MKKKDYKPIIDCVLHLDIPNKLEDLPLVPDHLEPRLGLQVHEGWKCTLCPEFRTTADQTMKRHMSQKHKLDKGLTEKPIMESVALQSWYQGRRYWIVRTLPHEPERHEEGGRTKGSSGAPENDFIDLVTQAESARLSKQRQSQNVLTSGNNVDDTTPWLNFTGWKKLFHGKDIVMISETRLLRTDDPQVHRMFEISPQKLQSMFDAFDVLVTRCMETLDGTPVEVRRWLNSGKRLEANPRPFHALQQESTFQRSARSSVSHGFCLLTF